MNETEKPIFYIGSLTVWYGPRLPEGWVRPTSKGILLDKKEYAALYAVVGNCYGEGTETKFRVGPARDDMIMKAL
jgi:microcystin-dependent protein